jgi:hypothetical protein
MVARLVIDHGQQLDQAWRFTVQEFFMVVDLKRYMARNSSTGYDREKVGELEQHIRNLGVAI